VFPALVTITERCGGELKVSAKIHSLQRVAFTRITCN